MVGFVNLSLLGVDQENPAATAPGTDLGLQVMTLGSGLLFFREGRNFRWFGNFVGSGNLIRLWFRASVPV